MGPRGYLSGGWRRFTYTDAYSYGNSDSDANTDDHAECNSHSYTYGNSHSNADSNSHTAIWHPNAASSQGNTKASAHSASAAESVIDGREVTSDW